MLTKAGRSSLDLRYLDPEEVRVFRGEDGRVYATIADEVTLISPAFMRSHPLTDPDRYLSILGTGASSIKARRTAFCTALKTRCSFWNLTSVLAGWILTSASLTGSEILIIATGCFPSISSP